MISLVIALVTPPTYVGRVTLLISPPAADTTISLSDVEVTQALAPTFAELATTTPLLDRVIAVTGISVDRAALAKAITTHVPVGTSLIDIEVANRDPGTAAALANAIADALRVYEADSSGQVLGLTLTIVDPAVVPTSHEGFGVPVQTGLGAAIALFLSISLAFFIENLKRGIQGVGRRLPISGGALGDEPRPPGRGRR